MYLENVSIPPIEIIRDRLTEQDYLDLKNSGLTDEQIVQNGHFSITDKKSAYQLTGINHRGLCFRYYDPSGSPYKSNGGKDFYRMKPRDWKENTSQQIDILDDPPKYLTEKDGGCKPYFSALYPHWKIALKRTKTTLYITEGEKKADCLCGHGKAAIGLSGVWGWMDKQGRTGEYDLPAPQEVEDDEEAQEQIGKLETSRVLPELAEIDWKYRRVVLCFDSDLTQKKPVKQALKQLAVWLTKQGAEPEILLLPTEIDGSKNGADDLIVRHGITAFEILDHFTFSALTYQKKIPLLNLPRDPILPLKAAMCEAVFKDFWRYRPNVGWYQWTGSYWKHNDSGSGVELEGELIKFINANSWIYQGSSNLTSLVRQLKAKLQKADWESPYKLAFSNGTLNLKTGEFIPAHHRDDFLTSALPYEFDPNAQCPKWLQFLNEALGGDNSVIGLLQAFFKWIVTPKTPALKIEKCLDLIGQPGTGKGTTLDILHAFAGGTENCAVIDSDTFNKSGENLASLLDKKVSIDSDASGFISNIGLFCKVVSNEPVRSRKLYKDTMNVRLNTVIVRAYNRFLDVQGATEALNRRIIAIPFDIKPDQPDIGLRSQLLEELPGIFAWAWSISEAEMKRRILWPGDSPAIASASTRRFEANNPEFTFLREIFPDGNEAVQPRGLYSTYKDWCKDVGISPKKERNFYDTIRPFGCEQGNKSDGYRHFSIPPMKDFDIMAHIGMRQPEKNASAKKVLPLVSPYLPMPCPEQVSAPSFLPDVSPPISPSDSGRNQGETDKTFLPDSNPVPVRHRELGRNEEQKVFTAVKTENGMTGWEKLQRERGAVFYSDVPREPQFQVGQMVWWEGKEYQVKHATHLRVNIELPDGIIKSVQNEEIAIRNWQVGDRCFVTSASESGEVLELCNDSLTFRVRLDSGEIAGYWANDLVLDPAALSPKTPEPTVEQAVETAELLIPPETLEAAPLTDKFKVGDRVRSHDQIGTILEVKNGSSVIVYWDDKTQTRCDQRFLSGKTAEGGELLPAPRGVANYLSLKAGDRVRILRHAQHKKSWWQKGGMVVTIKATRINPKTNELEANADIAGEGLPCTLSLDAVEVVCIERS